MHLNDYFDRWSIIFHGKGCIDYFYTINNKQKHNIMEFKGTKEGWRVNHGANMLPSVYSKELNLPIAHICKVSDEMRPFDNESEANAKLIAAAPDLLMVLQKILDYDLEEVYPGFNKDTGIKKAIQKALK